MNRTIAALFLTISVLLGGAGCGESTEVSYQRGRSDGYAVGYNTECKIRTTMIAGDWDNEHYLRGYYDGKIEGEMACRRR